MDKVVTNNIQFKTFNAKIKVDYESAENSDSYTGYLSIAKDSLIYIRIRGSFLGISAEGLQVKITKDSVVLVKKVGDKYVQYRTIDYLKEATQIPFDFSTLQDLLIGNPNRETQASAIVQSEKMLQDKIGVLSANKKERLSTLEVQNKQLLDLEQDKKEQDQVVAQLKGKEKELNKQIRDKENQRQKVAVAINAVIRREIEEAKKREEAKRLKALEDARKLKAAQDAAAAQAAADKKNATAKPNANNTVAANGVGAGAVVQWLRDGLQIIRSSAEVETLAAQVSSSDGVYVVPAFAGLGAPYWNQHARGTIVGITRGTTRAHIARAAVDSIAYQTMDVLKAMEADAGISIKELRVDGGATVNNSLMQFQSDLLQTSVVRPTTVETTALGAAYLAGLAVGYWGSVSEIQSIWQRDRVFTPAMSLASRDELAAGWAKAVGAAMNY
eukprot:gene34276-biopygen1648